MCTALFHTCLLPWNVIDFAKHFNFSQLTTQVFNLSLQLGK